MASAEYLTMVRCTSILTTAFESDPITIANDLHAKGFISPSVKNEVVDTIQANSYKASKLVGCVTSQISISSDSRVKGKFKAFVQVLEGHTWLADTVEDVIHKYEENGGHYERNARQPSSVSTNQASSPQVPNTVAQPRPWRGLTCPVDELNLMRVLCGVTGSKVHSFGIELGVPSNKISEFESNFPRENERVKSEILKYWLDNAEECSWKVIANAVRNIELKNLACYITGERGANEQHRTTRNTSSRTVPHSMEAVSHPTDNIRHRPNAQPTTPNNEQEGEVPEILESPSDSESESAHPSSGSEAGRKKHSGTGLLSKICIFLLLIIFALISINLIMFIN